MYENPEEGGTGGPLADAHDTIAYLKELFNSRLLAHWSQVGLT